MEQKKKTRSMVSIVAESKHKLNWLDVEHQIYDEDSSKVWELKLFGLTIWHRNLATVSAHKILKGSKKIGFNTGDEA